MNIQNVQNVARSPVCRADLEFIYRALLAVLEIRPTLLCLKYVVFPYFTCYVKHLCLCINSVT